MQFSFNNLTFVLAALSLAMTFAWTILNVPAKRMLFVSTIFAVLMGIATLLPVVLGSTAQFQNLFSFGGLFYPLLITWLTLIGALGLTVGRFEGKSIFATIAFGLNTALLLVGFELLKSSENGWKSLLPLTANLTILNALLVLQLLTYFKEANFTYGVHKLIAGAASFLLILSIGFDAGARQWFEIDGLQSRRNVIFISVILAVEGMLLIYKARKNRQREKVLP